MSRPVFFSRNLLVLIAGWSLYSGQHLNGIGILAVASGRITNSGSHRIDSPFLAARVVTNVHDFDTARSYPVASSTIVSHRYNRGENKMLQRPGLRSFLDDSDVTVITSSWNFVKRRLSDFAPKVFLRYFQVRPAARKMFPAFADTNLAELPTNRDFLSAAYSCVTSLTYIIPHFKYDHFERCPAFNMFKKTHDNVDVKKFGSIWVNAIQEEMGNNTFNDVVLHDAWKKAVWALRKYASS
ncbi:globin D, coelomic-like isoform X1 [Daphnia carinata]|uniref:globin D, coelomic-like isoform X1 n=1 Tax=Daphnia carinata TaxID=120202 RepID=UPI00257BF14B|nr:globin D, coelomic-like isoform X1 [Daphnia carinata]